MANFELLTDISDCLRKTFFLPKLTKYHLVPISYVQSYLRTPPFLFYPHFLNSQDILNLLPLHPRPSECHLTLHLLPLLGQLIPSLFLILTNPLQILRESPAARGYLSFSRLTPLSLRDLLARFSSLHTPFSFLSHLLLLSHLPVVPQLRKW